MNLWGTRMSNSLLLVATGGALGACLRYQLGQWFPLGLAGVPSVFPWTTVGINIAGSLAIGIVWSVYMDAHWFQAWGRALIVAGFLGGFTTFSAFSLEAMILFETHRAAAAIYVATTVVGCLVATAVGYWLGTYASAGTN